MIEESGTMYNFHSLFLLEHLSDFILESFIVFLNFAAETSPTVFLENFLTQSSHKNLLDKSKLHKSELDY